MQHRWCNSTSGIGIGIGIDIDSTLLNCSACRNHISDCHQRINVDANHDSGSGAVGPPCTREIGSDQAPTLVVPHTQRVTVSTSCFHSGQTACDHRGSSWTNWAQRHEDHRYWQYQSVLVSTSHSIAVSITSAKSGIVRALRLRFMHYIHIHTIGLSARRESAQWAVTRAPSHQPIAF